MTNNESKFEDQLCPSCKHRIGTPLDKSGKAIDRPKDNTVMFCIKCLEAIWTGNGKLEIMPREMFYQLLLIRPREMLDMLARVIHIRKHLGSMDN